jgi:HK97 family phage prohead protease
MERVEKTLGFEIKEIDEKTRSFLAVASTEEVDRDGDLIRVAGWDLTNFLKNPVIPWAHDYTRPPVAKAETAEVRDGKLVFRPRFPNPGDYPFADTVWRLYRDGFLRAFSVGFRPLKWEWVEREGADGARTRGRDFVEQELWEISACVVPANAHSLIASKLAEKPGKDDVSAAVREVVAVRVARVVGRRINYHLGAVMDGRKAV